MNNTSSGRFHLNLTYVQVLVARLELFDNLVYSIDFIISFVINGISLEI